MLLRNKKTGEIRELPDGFFCGDNLKKICEEWEDYEEPKEYWYISDFGYVFNHEINNKSVKSTIEEMKSIGNYFLSREEAELAVRKLKAFKRLKDKGFRFRGLCESVHELPAIEYDTDVDVSRDSQDVEKDLDLLFSEGGEE